MFVDFVFISRGRVASGEALDFGYGGLDGGFGGGGNFGAETQAVRGDGQEPGFVGGAAVDVAGQG